MNATGYIEIADHLRGKCTLPDAVERIRSATRSYARRQLTWFRNQVPEAVKLDATRDLMELADEIAQRYRTVESV